MIDSNETIMYENGRDFGYSAGYSDGYNDGIIAETNILCAKPTDSIVLFYDTDKTRLSELSDIVDMLKEKFPDNNVLALPNHTSLEKCSKNVLEDIISMISNIVKSQ